MIFYVCICCFILLYLLHQFYTVQPHNSIGLKFITITRINTLYMALDLNVVNCVKISVSEENFHEVVT